MKIVLRATQPHQHKRVRLLTSIIALFSILGLRSIYLQTHPQSVNSYAMIQGSLNEKKVIQSKASQQLIWSDEFNGSVNQPPNQNTWSAEIGGGNKGWGNQQKEYDTNNNAYQDGKGKLVIEARKENPANYKCWYGACLYTSARLDTNTHYSVQYGRIEARIKIPKGQGLWPAFWLLGTNISTVGWPACGEIDVMENIGKIPNTIYGTIHGSNISGSGTYGFGGQNNLSSGNFADGYHIYAVQWDNSQVSFSMDNVNYSTITKANAIQRNGQWVFDHPFYIILNNAVGGGWPGDPNQTTVFPQKMYVDYVRVYK